MPNPNLISGARTCTVQATKGRANFRLTISLGDEFNGGEWVRLADGALFDVQGADEMAASYGTVNWLCGVATGSRYAFRALKIPMQRVNVREYTGRLGSAHLETVSIATSLAIAKLAQRELPPLPTNGWHIDCQVSGSAAPDNGASSTTPEKQIA